MSATKPLRVMWLLNHTSARKFEVPMLKSLGVREIFLPKIVPDDPSFRSGSVDWSEDVSLTIPSDDLAALNAVNWYEGVDRAAWEIASRHFDLCFYILRHPDFLEGATRYFEGVLLWRAYGQANALTCHWILDYLTDGKGKSYLKALGHRHFFAKAYEHIDRCEPEFLRKGSVYLPLGLNDAALDDHWIGDEAEILFVCPDIAFNEYYRGIYEQFREDFAGLPYVVGGAQPLAVDDPCVLGFVTQSKHEQNMRRKRVMFYHSREENHIHYTPFEAVRAGMPLVFMGGGMLDRLGGRELPGRCETVAEARVKVERLLKGDKDLIGRIRESQPVLLEPMKASRCEPAWRVGMARVISELNTARAEGLLRTARPRKRIAVILPEPYRGGTLRGAKMLAEALAMGSREFGEDVDVVFAYPENKEAENPEEFEQLAVGISVRSFRWKRLSAEEAGRAMRYAGLAGVRLGDSDYVVPDDGICQMLDCDLWLVVSDRLPGLLLPIKPVVLMIYDYLQRYFPELRSKRDVFGSATARRAKRVLVTTDFTYQDALQYAGLPARKVARVPMLAQIPSAGPRETICDERSYFLWPTNLGVHKNHANALKALTIYYEELGGRLSCSVSGVHSSELPESKLPHLKEAVSVLRRCKMLRDNLRWKGELSESGYRRELAGAAFVWHPAALDNGTFCLVEAAAHGVPSLSSEYPAMREMDTRFGLNLAWMDATKPDAMAEKIKEMESSHVARRALLPSDESLARNGVGALAVDYWKVIRECL